MLQDHFLMTTRELFSYVSDKLEQCVTRSGRTMNSTKCFDCPDDGLSGFVVI